MIDTGLGVANILVFVLLHSKAGLLFLLTLIFLYGIVGGISAEVISKIILTE